jgi:hypothetical protein
VLPAVTTTKLFKSACRIVAPLFSLVPFAGVLADRLKRHSIMAITPGALSKRRCWRSLFYRSRRGLAGDGLRACSSTIRNAAGY